MTLLSVCRHPSTATVSAPLMRRSPSGVGAGGQAHPCSCLVDGRGEVVRGPLGEVERRAHRGDDFGLDEPGGPRVSPIPHAEVLVLPDGRPFAGLEPATPSLPWTIKPQRAVF